MSERDSYLAADRAAVRGDAATLVALRADPELATHLDAVEATPDVPEWALALAEPSYLAVDAATVRHERTRLAPLRGHPDWDAHLAAVEAVPDVPQWALRLGDAPRRSGLRRWGLVIASLATALAIWLLVVRPPPDPYVGAKGGAAALIHVERDGRVLVWDGASPLGPPDRFRIELTGLSEPWFVVVYRDPEEPPAVLATGQGDGLVDGAWAFDGPADGGRVEVYGFPTRPEPEAWRFEEPSLVVELE